MGEDKLACAEEEAAVTITLILNKMDSLVNIISDLYSNTADLRQTLTGPNDSLSKGADPTLKVPEYTSLECINNRIEDIFKYSYDIGSDIQKIRTIL
ncbi:MAG: hypothetical protein PHI79_06760 [Sulfurovaceae bacterium]|nr:hypothetical protein [Sulfurovaceae bacterium]